MFLQKNIPCLASASCAQYNLRRQRGATSIEYALLSALIALFILVSVGSTGSAVFNLWTNIEDQVTAAITTALQ